MLVAVARDLFSRANSGALGATVMVWRRCIGSLLKRVWWRWAAMGPVVGNVGHRLGVGAKPRWGAHPAHRENERQCNEGVLSWVLRQCHCKFGDGAVTKADTIETIRQVNLSQLNRTKTRIGVTY